MKRTLDVLFVKSTGHVLTLAARAGEDAGPSLELLAGPGLTYPADDSGVVLDVAVPATVVMDKVSVPLADDNVDALFQRKAYVVKDGAPTAGLAATGLTVTFTSGQVTLKLAAGTLPELPYVIVGVPTGGGEPSAQPGVIPASTPQFDVPQSFPGATKVLAFVKGFVPQVR